LDLPAVDLEECVIGNHSVEKLVHGSGTEIVESVIGTSLVQLGPGRFFFGFRVGSRQIHDPGALFQNSLANQIHFESIPLYS